MTRPENHVLSIAAQRAEPWDVLAFIGSLDVGGCERHLASVFPQLARAGLKVGIVTLVKEGQLANDLRAGGVDVVCLDRGYEVGSSRWRHWFRLFGWLTDLIRLFRTNRVRVAHFFLPGAYIVGGFSAYVAGFSNRVMSRRSLNDYQRGHAIATRIEHFLHKRMSVLTANANEAVNQLVAEGAPRARCLFLPNGVDLIQIDNAPGRAESRAALDIPDDMLTIVTVANLISYKGHLDLIEALAQISNRLPQNWQLLLVGRDDGILSKILRSAEANGIRANVRWLGQRSDVPVVLATADIGVLASHEEGMPNSLLEGMAASLPMVATGVGGVVDIVTDGIDGLLVPKRDAPALGEAVLRLALDPVLRQKLGVAARRRVEESFSLQSNVDAYLRLYRSLLERDGRYCSKRIVSSACG